MEKDNLKHGTRKMYNNNQSSDKPLPSIEYSLKSIGWNIKVISETLVKILQIIYEEKINEDKENKRDLPF